MSSRTAYRETCVDDLTRSNPNADEAGMRQWANALGVPLAYLYADNSDLAEVILAFGLLPEPEQRRLAVELKARVSPPVTVMKVCPVRRAPATRRTR